MKTPTSKPKRGSIARSDKMRGLYQRGKIFWYTKMVNGARTQMSLETDRYEDAVRKVLEIRQNPTLAPVDTFAHEVRNYIRTQEASGRLSPGLAPIRENTLLNFATQYGIVTPDQITSDKVKEWYNWMRLEKTPALRESTAQAYIFGLRAFLGWLVDRGALRQNVAAKVELDTLRSNARPLFCRSDLVAGLIQNAPNDELRLILYCGFHAGMRKEEIIEARPNWFDLRAGCVNIISTDTFTPKDKENRSVPLTAEFKAFLAKYGKPSPYMLAPEVGYGGGRWVKYRYDFRRPFKDYIKSYGEGRRLGIEKLDAKEDLSWITPHIMRHTFASLHAIAGTSIYKIALWLGDDVRTVQKHYAKLSPSDEDINKAFA
jgi:integrase